MTPAAHNDPGAAPTPRRSLDRVAVHDALVDGVIRAWQCHVPSYGPLTSAWLGHPKPTTRRLALLAHLMNCVASEIDDRWSIDLDTDQIDGDPIAVLVCQRGRCDAIEVTLTGRAIKIDSTIVALAERDAGFRLIDVLGSKIASHLVQRQWRGRR